MEKVHVGFIVPAILALAGCGGAADSESSATAGTTSGGASNASGATSQVGGKSSSGGNSAIGGTGIIGGNSNTGGLYETCLVCSGGRTLLGTGGATALGGNNPTGGAVGQGGSATGGQTSLVSCSDPDATLGNSYKVVSTTVGNNGSFTDTCDNSGNLIEYYCETSCLTPYYSGIGGATGVQNAIACMPQSTGKVLPGTVGCAGRCSAGHCFEWCPNFDDTATLVNVGATGATIRTAPGYDLACQVLFTQPGFDCQATNLTGTQVKVVSLGTCSGTISVFGTSLPNSAGNQACTFQCQVPS